MGREEAARVRAHFNPGKREPFHSSRNLEAHSCYYYGNGSAPNSPRFQHHHQQSESFSSLPPNVDNCPPPPSSLDER